MKLHKDELIMTVLLVIILFLAAFMRVTKRETGFQSNWIHGFETGPAASNTLGWSRSLCAVGKHCLYALTGQTVSCDSFQKSITL